MHWNWRTIQVVRQVGSSACRPCILHGIEFAAPIIEHEGRREYWLYFSAILMLLFGSLLRYSRVVFGAVFVLKVTCFLRTISDFTFLELYS